MRSASPAALAALAFGLLLPSPAQADWKEDFCLLLKDLGKTAATLKKDNVAALEIEARAQDPKTAGPAALFLFTKDRPLEALWWEKEDRVSRALIVSLYRATESDEKTDFAAFARRFRPEEAHDRAEELEFVTGHLSAIAALLARAEKSLGIHGSYDLLRQKAGEASGEPLLCVPDLE
jgi:hypothetical protein